MARTNPNGNDDRDAVVAPVNGRSVGCADGAALDVADVVVVAAGLAVGDGLPALFARCTAPGAGAVVVVARGDVFLVAARGAAAFDVPLVRLGAGLETVSPQPLRG
jgi:hypothetical protein